MRKKEFAAAVLDPKHKIFVVYVASLSFSLLTNADVYLFHRPQIAGLIAKEVFIKVSTKYINFVDMFFLTFASNLSKHTQINNYIIKLVNNQQTSYTSIYSLMSVELEILKTYIEINLVNGLIKLSKSPANFPIFFKKKSDKLLWLCVNYRNFNNFTIKN